MAVTKGSTQVKTKRRSLRGEGNAQHARRTGAAGGGSQVDGVVERQAEGEANGALSLHVNDFEQVEIPRVVREEEAEAHERGLVVAGLV